MVTAEAVPSKREERSTDDADGDVVHTKRSNGRFAQNRRCLLSRLLSGRDGTAVQR